MINVRFGPFCGLKADISRGPRSAITGLMLWITAGAFDYSNVNQNFATNVALHQREMRPSGFVTGSMRPPGVALGSPVKTKQFSFDRLVS